MRKRIVSVFLLALLTAVSMLPVSALKSGYEIDYSDSVQWDKFRGKNVSINVYNWGEYISVDEGGEDDYDVNAEFTRLTGITVNYTNFATNEEMYAKLKMGGTSYDIVIPSDYMVSRLINEGLVRKINFKNIPNFSNIDEQFRKTDYDPTGEYSVPYLWGIVGIIYNTTLVDEEDDVGSWDILWNEKYANEILMFSNSRDAFGVAEFKLGISPNTTSEEDLRAAAQALIDQKPIVQAYVMDEIFDKMAGGEAALAPYYAGDAITMMADNPDLDFVVPREGTNLFIDAICIPSTSKNPEAAEMYINFLCETLVAKRNAEYVGYATPNAAAFEELDEETRTSVTYPDAEVVANSQQFIALPSATTTLLDSLWTDILSTGEASPWTIPIFMGGCLITSCSINIGRWYKKKRKDGIK